MPEGWRRTPHADLDSVCQLLVEILTELKHMNSAEHTGAVSSAELKFLANGTPQPVVKAYAGSEVPVDEAIEAYGRMIREANMRAMNGWQETIEDVEGWSKA